MGYALDLLNQKDEIPRPLINELYNPVLLGVAGFGMCSFANFLQRRPLLAGIQMHIGMSIAGVILGTYVNKWRDSWFADNDAVLRHYVELHPEAFPDPDRKKFKDVFVRWPPVR